MTTYNSTSYKYVKYDSDWYVIPDFHYEEYMSIPRNSIRPKVDPYKFSVAKISSYEKKPYVTLTNYEFEFDVGFQRDWIDLVEAINEGLRLWKKDRERPLKKKSRWEQVRSLL